MITSSIKLPGRMVLSRKADDFGCKYQERELPPLSRVKRHFLPLLGDKLILVQAHGCGTITTAGSFDTQSLKFSHHLKETVLYSFPHGQFVFAVPKILHRIFFYNRNLSVKLSQCAVKSLTKFFQLTLGRKNREHLRGPHQNIARWKLSLVVMADQNMRRLCRNVLKKIHPSMDMYVPK